jgi:peroxidase
MPYPYCPLINITCNFSIPWRTFDGSCNNRNHTWWGRSRTPFRRLLPSEYQDYVQEPRMMSVIKKRYLPNARVLALSVHAPKKTSSEWSHLTTIFGQFVDHDITLTPKVTYNDGYRKRCQCGTYDSECVNIPIPQYDKANYKDQKCMPFARSIGSIRDFNCNLGPKEQLNAATHWLDGSGIYGHNKNRADILRLFADGRLKVLFTRSGEMLPFAPNSPCNASYSSSYNEFSYSGMGNAYQRYGKCYLIGDDRGDESAWLSSIHTVFVRLHNIFADGLRRMSIKFGLGWNDERLFQTARKMVIGVLQNVVYGEFLPTLLGEKIAKAYGLLPLARGFFQRYKRDLYGTILNEFATAAFRYGHTQVPLEHRMADRNYKLSNPLTVDKYLFNNKYYQTYMNDILRGSWMYSSYYPSSQCNEYMNDHLFENMHFGEALRISLPAYNIQRGREHGLSSYNKYRALCGLNRAYRFEDFHNIPAHIIKNFKELYAHPDDVDCWTGMVSEYPLEGAMVGATAACKI